MENQKRNYSGFVVIGAGLPRTGTLSTRAALYHLLDGACYHMAEVYREGQEEAVFWKKALDGKLEKKDWVDHLQGKGYRCGVDYPISLFYKELMEAFPDAKVLLTVRNPSTWYDSVHNSIYQIHEARRQSWTVRAYQWLIGMGETCETIDEIARHSPKGFEKGMLDTIDAGPKKAERFFNQWVSEVKATVPKERLLEFSVKEGWEPLCKFLDVPVPAIPFPHLNDTASIQKITSKMKMVSYLVVWGIPVLVLSGVVAFCFRNGVSDIIGGRRVTMEL